MTRPKNPHVDLTEARVRVRFQPNMCAAPRLGEPRFESRRAADQPIAPFVPSGKSPVLRARCFNASTFNRTDIGNQRMAELHARRR